MTTVVNIYKDEYDVYIGRPGKGHKGPFGNPIIIGRPCPFCDKIHRTGEATLPCYKEYLLQKIAYEPDFRKRLLELRGKRLGCFCKPKPCHGDIIKEWLDENI